MKTITIGRGDGVDIFIDDEMISRRHALLRIYASGKMEIVDMGKNGTFVNGVKLRPNVPFPVKRKDVVSFAEVSRLNWSQVPDNTKYFKIGAIIIGAIIALLILIGIGSFCYNKFFAKGPAQTEYQQEDGAQQGGQGGAQQGGQSGNVSSVNQNEKSEGQSGSGSSGNKDEAQEKELSRKDINRIFSPTPKDPKDNAKKKDAGKKDNNQKPEQKQEQKKEEAKKNKTVVM